MAPTTRPHSISDPGWTHFRERGSFRVQYFVFENKAKNLQPRKTTNPLEWGRVGLGANWDPVIHPPTGLGSTCTPDGGRGPAALSLWIHFVTLGGIFLGPKHPHFSQKPTHARPPPPQGGRPTHRNTKNQLKVGQKLLNFFGPTFS